MLLSELTLEEAEEKIALVSPMLQRVVELSGCADVKGLITFLQSWEEMTQQALNCTPQSSGSIGRKGSKTEQRTRFSHFTTEIEGDANESCTSSPGSPEMDIERRRSSLQLELSMNKPIVRTKTGLLTASNAVAKPDAAYYARRRASLPVGDALQFRGKVAVCCSPNLTIPNDIDAQSLLRLPSVPPPPPPPQDCNLASPLMMFTSKFSHSSGADRSPMDAQAKYIMSPTLSVLDLLDRPNHDKSPQDGIGSRRGSTAQRRRLSADTTVYSSGFHSRKHSQHSETMTHKSSYRKKNVFSNAALRARLSMIPDDLASVHRTMSEDITETNDGLQTSEGDLLGSVDMQYDVEERYNFPRTTEQVSEDQTKATFDKFDLYWKPLLFLYSLYQLIMIPSRIGLDSNPSWGVSIIDLVVDAIWWFEIFCNFYRPYERQGLYVTKNTDIWQNYLKGHFLFDLLIAVPFEVIGFGLYSRNGSHISAWRKETAIMSPYWRINKVLLVRYSDDMFSNAFKSLYNGHPLVTRSVRTIWSFTLITHYFACGLLVLLFYEGEETGVRFTQMREMYNFDDITTQYFLAYDYSVKAMVGMGRPGRTMPQTDLQAIFCLITAFAGVALYATVLATIANLVSDEVSESEKWRNKINQVTDVLQYINKARDPLPNSLTSAIRGYYHHTFWISRVLLGRMDEVIPDLPIKISVQVQQVVGGETMARVPMFKAASAADSQFLHYMLYNLEPVTFCEHEIVMEKGDEGDGMYFLLAGAMGVLSDKTGEVVFVLHRGSFLGEIALIHDCRRTATVKALTCCSAFRLSKTVFKEAAALFPKAISRVEAEAGDRLQKIKLEEIVKKVPLFAALDDDPDFIREVVGALEPKVHPPGTEVVVKGEIGTEMFFVAQGELSVRVDGKTVHTMKEGSFFGEIVMLFDTRRTASIFAETYVDLFTLSKIQFRSVMNCYPAQASQIAETGRERFRAFLVEDLLKKIHLFASLKHRVDFLDRLAQALKPRPMDEDQMLVTAGDLISELFFISTGEVTVINEDDCVSAILKAGDYFGGISMLRDYTSLTTLYCRASGEIYSLSRGSFDELASEFPSECAILRDFALGQLKKMVCIYYLKKEEKKQLIT